MKLFVTGIDTNIGKTICSAILCKALGADYFKPIQSGDLDSSDTMRIGQFGIKTFPEALKLPLAKSPNFSSPEPINLDKILLPSTSQPLVVEGAGGVLVPLNDQHYIIDLAKKWQLPAVLVCQSYLGSLNHTLLSVEALRARNIKILGLIFNGEKNSESESFLEKRTKLKIILKVSLEKKFTLELVERYSKEVLL